MKKRALSVILIKLAVAVAFVGAVSMTSDAQDFYAGKTLKVIVPYNPGGGSDVFARLLARSIGDHIPGRPSVVVQNIIGGGGIVALNYLYNIAKPDGLTIGHTSIPGVRDQLVGSEGVKHDYRKFGYVGSGGPTLQLFAIRGSLPYMNVEALKKARKQIFVAAGSPASTPGVVGRILALEGANIKVVPGYRGSAPRVQALVKGEADATTIIVMQAKREKENLRPLFWVAAKGTEFTNLPLLEELPLSTETGSFIKAVTIPLIVARTFLAPPDTPQDRLKILQQAFEKTVTSDDFKKLAARAQLPVRWMSAEDTKGLTLKVLDTPPQAVATLKEIMGLSN